MLEKPGKGPYLKKLRIIQLVESDLNFVLGLIWGRRLGRKCQLDKSLEATQFATGGQLCNSAALTTCLFYDIHRQSREPAASAMLDAKACFDRNLPALAIPVSRKYGVPEEAALFLFRELRATSFRIRTAHGVSTASFAVMDNPSRPLCRVSVKVWVNRLAYMYVLQMCLTKPLQSFIQVQSFSTSIKPSRRYNSKNSLFMDDTTLYTNIAGITKRLMRQHGWTRAKALEQALQHLIQTYNQYLWTTGG
jgi:hypothetical protein